MIPLVVVFVIIALGAICCGLYLAKKRQQQEQNSHGMDTVKGSITAISTVPAPYKPVTTQSDALELHENSLIEGSTHMIDMGTYVSEQGL